MKTKIIDGWEYECETHDFNKILGEIKIPKGWQLWSIEDCVKLHNIPKYKIELNLQDCWFFIKQPFNQYIHSVAGFNTSSDWAGLSCGWGPTIRDDHLGVRFKRRVRK